MPDSRSISRVPECTQFLHTKPAVPGLLLMRQLRIAAAIEI
jgi:hypothetical protein